MKFGLCKGRDSGEHSDVGFVEISSILYMPADFFLWYIFDKAWAGRPHSCHTCIKPKWYNNIVVCKSELKLELSHHHCLSVWFLYAYQVYYLLVLSVHPSVHPSVCLPEDTYSMWYLKKFGILGDVTLIFHSYQLGTVTGLGWSLSSRYPEFWGHWVQNGEQKLSTA